MYPSKDAKSGGPKTDKGDPFNFREISKIDALPTPRSARTGQSENLLELGDVELTLAVGDAVACEPGHQFVLPPQLLHPLQLPSCASRLVLNPQEMGPSYLLESNTRCGAKAVFPLIPYHSVRRKPPPPSSAPSWLLYLGEEAVRHPNVGVVSVGHAPVKEPCCLQLGLDMNSDDQKWSTFWRGCCFGFVLVDR